MMIRFVETCERYSVVADQGKKLSLLLRRCLTGLTVLAAGIFLSGVPEASALTSYADLVGGAFTFSNLEEETLTSGDPDPIWGAPTLVGDALLFTPLNYTSNAVGGAVDTTEGVFRIDIVANNKASGGISTLEIAELGDYSLTGLGTALTQASATGSIDVTVNEINLGGVLTAVSISLSDLETVSFNTPTSAGDWTLSLGVDISAALESVYGSGAAQATEVSLAWNNDLATGSESGSTAQIQKKLGVPAVTLQVLPIPEPGTALLMGLGLLGLCLAGRVEGQ